METHIYMSSKQEKVNRQIYSMFHVLTDMGGLLKAIQIMFALTILPFSNYLYILSMMRRLYFFKTSDDDLFVKVED